MDELKVYSSFLLGQQWDDLCTLFSEQAGKKTNVAQNEEVSVLTVGNFKRILESVGSDSFPDVIDEIILHWKGGKYSETRFGKPLSQDLIELIGISKICLIRFIKAYTGDLDKGLSVMEQLSSIFDAFMKQAFSAYQDVHVERLAEEKEFIETVLDTTVEGVTGIDKDMKIMVWNKALENRTGIKKEQILGRNFAEFFPKNAQGFELEIIKEAQKGKKVHFEGIPLKWRKGFYDIDILPLRNRSGEVVGSLSFSRDVSEKVETLEQLRSTNKKLREKQKDLNRTNQQLQEKVKELEEMQTELERQSQFIRSILNATPDFITVFNVATKKNVFVNRSVKEYLGYEDISGPREEGMKFLQKIIHPDDLVAVGKFLNGFGKNKKQQMLEYRIKDKGGHYRWIRGRYNTLWENEAGEPVEVVGLSRDVTEEKLHQQKVEEALNHYLHLLEDFPAMIWRSGTDGSSNYFNNTWLQFTGRKLEDEIGDGWSESIHEEDTDRCLDIYRANFRARKSFEMEYRLKRHDGAYRWVMDFGKPIYGLKGEFEGYLGVCFDIQERKDYEVKINEANQELAAALEELQSTEEQLVEMNAELERKIQDRTRELARSQERLQKNLEDTLKLNRELADRENFLASIVEQTPVSTWISDSRGVQVKVNQAYLDLFNITNSQRYDGKYNILEDKKLQKEPFFSDIKAVYDKGEMAKFTMKYEVPDRLRNKKEIYLSIAIFPIKNKDGEIMNVVVKHEDFTERIKAENALKDSEEQMRAITDAIPALIAYYDNNLKYRFVNQLYSKWFNKKREDFIGKPVTHFIEQEIREVVRKRMQEALAGRIVNFESEVTFPNKKVGFRNMMVTYVPRKLNGQVIGFFALGNDITQLKKFQNQLIEKNKELTRINNDLDNFVYTASHDLKSPIVNLEGLILALKRTVEAKLSARETKLLSMMNKSVSKLKETIDYLGDATKAVSFEEKAETLSIPDIVKSVKTDIRNLIKEANAEIIEKYDEKDVIFVRGNLKSIFYNLLTNAIKYRAPGRALKIMVHTYRQNNYLVISVADNGLGLSAKQQSKLFTMFKRMHKHVEGSGIGLYILKRMVENANGKVEVDSEENKGSNFKILIPAEHEEG